LLHANAESGLPKYLEQLHRFDAIICDEVGYFQHTADEMEVLFSYSTNK